MTAVKSVLNKKVGCNGFTSQDKDFLEVVSSILQNWVTTVKNVFNCPAVLKVLLVAVVILKRTDFEIHL